MGTQDQLLNAKPKKDDRIIISEEDGVVTLLDPDTGKMFILNEVAQCVLELSEGDRSIQEIVDIIAQKFAGKEKAQITDDVINFLNACEQKKMIRWS